MNAANSVTSSAELDKRTAANAAQRSVGAVKQRSLLQLRLGRLYRNKGAVVGLGLLLVIVATATLAPIIAPYDPVVMAPADRMQPPNTAHWFGTDPFGRDILSRILNGYRVSLAAAIAAVAIGSLSGVTLGLIAGYAGRWVDATIMKFMDMLLAFPSILLALSIVAMIGSGLINAMFAVGISSIPTYARVTRGEVLALKTRPYIEAARVVGCGNVRIAVRHILPNISGSVIVLSALNIAWAILTIASLSFLGLGVQPPTPELGGMLNDGRNYLSLAPWITVFPGLGIMLLVMAVNLLGDGIRDALDPSLTA
jgi:peptide/nickel transport system permease protein